MDSSPHVKVLMPSSRLCGLDSCQEKPWKTLLYSSPWTGIHKLQCSKVTIATVKHKIHSFHCIKFLRKEGITMVV